MDTLGKRLRQARRSRDMTQEEAAAALGVNRVSVSNWERGDAVPTDENLERLAELYGVPAAVLKYGQDYITAHRPSRVSESLVLYLATVEERLAALPVRAQVLVHRYLDRLREAGVPQERVDEALRVMVDSNYSQLHARDPRQRTEDEIVTDIDAAWAAIATALRAAGHRV